MDEGTTPVLAGDFILILGRSSRSSDHGIHGLDPRISMEMAIDATEPLPPAGRLSDARTCLVCSSSTFSIMVKPGDVIRRSCPPL